MLKLPMYYNILHSIIILLIGQICILVINFIFIWAYWIKKKRLRTSFMGTFQEKLSSFHTFLLLGNYKMHKIMCAKS